LKILIACSTLDLKYKLGCTPSWWQLFKAMHEIGHEVIAVPYLGDPVESLWWRTYPNPCATESKIYNTYLEWKKCRGKLPKHNEKTNTLLNRFAEIYVRGKWEKHLNHIIEKEKNIDAVLFVNIPINHIKEYRPTFAANMGFRWLIWMVICRQYFPSTQWIGDSSLIIT